MQNFKNMMKQAGMGCLFFLILLVLLTGVSRVMIEVAKKNKGMVMGRNKNIAGICAEPENTIDVLVVGDSLSYCSVSPMQLYGAHGITAYNCGQSGQKIQETYYALKTAFQSQRPKIVLLETNVLFREQKGVEGLKAWAAELGNHYFSVFRFHDMWKAFVTGNKYGEESYKGFVLHDAVKAYEGNDYMAESGEKKAMTEMVKFYMDKIIDLCKENKSELLLVSMPSPLNYNYAKHNTLHKYTQEKGLDYLNLNLYAKELGIDWKKDTTDRGDHLNLLGAYKVTDYLGAYLARYHLPDHRVDSAYADWENKAKEYDQKAAEKMSGMQ